MSIQSLSLSLNELRELPDFTRGLIRIFHGRGGSPTFTFSLGMYLYDMNETTQGRSKQVCSPIPVVSLVCMTVYCPFVPAR